MKPLKIIEFSYDPNPSGVMGFYDEDVPGYVYVRKNLGGYERGLIVAHESQHAKCHETKCKCWGKSSNLLSEYHAFCAELDYMCSHRFAKLIWTCYFRTIIEALKRYRANRIWKTHFMALARVCRTKRFEKCAYSHKRQHNIIMKLVSEEKR